MAPVIMTKQKLQNSYLVTNLVFQNDDIYNRVLKGFAYCSLVDAARLSANPFLLVSFLVNNDTDILKMVNFIFL